MIQKPMLAGTLPSENEAVMPTLATPKIDGIRALVVGGRLVSRTLKLIPNTFVRETLESLLPEGADGELRYGDTFQSSTSATMTADFKPSRKQPNVFTYFWFDYVKDSPTDTYQSRMQDIQNFMTEHSERIKEVTKSTGIRIVPLYPIVITTVAELHDYETKVLDEGYEGVMLRKPNGPYKYGRSTLREGILLKLKRFSDAEAVVIGVEELMHNHNEAFEDALGHAKRSSHKKNKVAAGVLGALICHDHGVRFKVGSGFTGEQREQMWQHTASLIGKTCKYKFLQMGVKKAPRHPIFLGFRDPDHDM